ncbi:PilW family protein [Chitinibacter sp. S2-10]|uniref:PilW family protein n=1 Tax=Chitinibacter sp. S2-10 TaxID=3373597 RepID=UPI003977AD58
MDAKAMHNKKISGFTLIELMISMVIGLLLLSAAFSFFLSNMSSVRDLMVYSKVQQELRMVSDLIQRELRRAGYAGNGNSAVGTLLLKRQQTATTHFDCVLYYYNTPSNTASTNSFGFLLDNKGTLWMKTAGATFNTSNDKTCPSNVSTSNTTNGTWRPLTSSPSSSTATDGIVKITSFDIAMKPPNTTGSISMSAANSGNIITRPSSGSGSNSFITDGFKEGDLVSLYGFASANNFVQAKIKTITDTTMTLEQVSSTGVATVLTNDAMAGSRTIERQGNSLEITFSGSSPKDTNVNNTYTVVVDLTNIQAIDAAF